MSPIESQIHDRPPTPDRRTAAARRPAGSSSRHLPAGPAHWLAPAGPASWLLTPLALLALCAPHPLLAAAASGADAAGAQAAEEAIEGAAGSAPLPSPTGEVSLEDALGESVDPLAQIERQIEAEEYLPAMRVLEEQIGAIEAQSHRYDPRLIRPLTLLGDAEAGLGEFESALGHYQRALHLNRVNHGLTSPEQVEIVYREADTFRALGQYRQANDREEYAYHVLLRTHEPLDDALLPGIFHLADWYENTGNVFAARALYQQAADIMEANDKLDTVEAIPVWRGIATSYRMERFPPYYQRPGPEQTGASIVGARSVSAGAVPTPITVNNFPLGEEALTRIIRIREREEHENPVALAEAFLDLADWYVLFEKFDRAETLYARAWELMDGVESLDVAAYFAEPELLYFPAPDDPTPPSVDERGDRTTGYVEVAFDVTDEGFVRGLRTINSEPRNLMDFRVRKSLRLARYRPMLVDGVPVAKQAHTYRHEFPYYPQREVDPQTAATAAGG